MWKFQNENDNNCRENTENAKKCERMLKNALWLGSYVKVFKLLPSTFDRFATQAVNTERSDL